MPSGPQLQRGLAELEDDTVVLDAGIGEVRRPLFERGAVGDGERDVVERTLVARDLASAPPNSSDGVLSTIDTPLGAWRSAT